MRPVLAVAGAELRRFLRDKSNIFFVFIFPLLLVLVLGSQFGGSGGNGNVTIAGEAGDLREAITTQLESQDVGVQTADHATTLEQVSRGRTDAGLILPDGAEAAYQAGDPVTLEVVPGSGANGMATQQQLTLAVGALQLHEAQVTALTDLGVDSDRARTELSTAADQVTLPGVQVQDVDEVAQEFAGVGKFDVGASSQLLLFVFLTSLAGSATLIQSRSEGVIARSLAAPVSSTQVLLGQAAGRFVIAAFQGIYIMVATGLLFGVSWGNPALSVLVLLCFSAVAAGAAMLLGASLDNAAAASGVGVGLGLVLAGIGGGMVPLEIFSDTMRQVAHFTPHAWAYDALAKITRHDAGLVDILPELGVLVGIAAAVLLLGTWALRRSVARAM
ncbi:ABC transporter permease [Ornithinicoccus hortensis]|uniref:ABC-2 type transport system permease protein n=1 Tax=Ornithinicoccus hortensis TaxID=82346 RepID=A0A542YTU0_9MICO|nr:ABC transporter permease [Ornithinicoccus hortensis]TQL51513.1 ABC-2 type transport system permease protein [Ornithinicoccus hortensis]